MLKFFCKFWKKIQKKEAFRSSNQHVQAQIFHPVIFITCLAYLCSVVLHDISSDHYDKKTSSKSSDIAKGSNIEKEVSLDEDDGLFLITSLDIGLSHYVNMSQFLNITKS